MEDDKIIELFWQRNESALRETDRKYSRYCFGIAWNILFNQEDCEECVNDTWFSAWRKMPPTKPAILSAFLGKITRDHAIDCLRRKNAAKRGDLYLTDIEAELDNLNRIAIHTLEEDLEEKELLKEIEHFLHKLSIEDRDIFIRRYWYADSIKEIAERHQCSMGKVKSRLYRNRKKLGKVLERR